MENLTRRNIRYICFRLQTEALGYTPARREKDGIMQYVDDVREHMEDQEDFGGWIKFGKTWDVDDNAPLVVVTRTSSIQTEWGRIIEQESQAVPQNNPSKKHFLANKLRKIVQKKKKNPPVEEFTLPVLD